MRTEGFDDIAPDPGAVVAGGDVGVVESAAGTVAAGAGVEEPGGPVDADSEGTDVATVLVGESDRTDDEELSPPPPHAAASMPATKSM